MENLIENFEPAEKVNQWLEVREEREFRESEARAAWDEMYRREYRQQHRGAEYDPYWAS